MLSTPEQLVNLFKQHICTYCTKEGKCEICIQKGKRMIRAKCEEYRRRE